MSYWVAGGVVVSSIGSSLISSNASSDASDAASSANRQAQLQQMQQMQQIMNMLKPYRKAGKAGLAGETDLLGLNGADKQQAAISSLEQSPYFTSLVQNGENAILQNASATGGLRGGNTQGALAQFRPAMLAQTIENQYNKLAGLAARGQNAAVNTGAGMSQYGSSIGNLIGQNGQMQAQGIMAQGQTGADLFGQLGQLFGQYKGQQNWLQSPQTQADLNYYQNGGSGFAVGEPNGGMTYDLGQ